MIRPRSLRAVPARPASPFDPRPAPRIPAVLWFALGALAGGAAAFVGVIASWSTL